MLKYVNKSFHKKFTNMRIRYHIQTDSENGNFERVLGILIDLGLMLLSKSYQSNPDCFVLTWKDPTERNLDYKTVLHRALYSWSRRIVVDDFTFFYTRPNKIDVTSVEDPPLDIAIQKSLKVIKGQVHVMADEKI